MSDYICSCLDIADAHRLYSSARYADSAGIDRSLVHEASETQFLCHVHQFENDIPIYFSGIFTSINPSYFGVH